MRFYIFFALLLVALGLDLGLLALALMPTQARSLAAQPALAATLPTVTATFQPSATPTAQPTATLQPSATPTAQPTATLQPSATPTAQPTATVPAPQLLAAKSVSFTPADRAVKANIHLALAHYQGALTHVVLAPGDVFSFNAALGLRPQRLAWKDVIIKSTPAPASADAAPEQAPAEPTTQRVQGGGLCDLASRFVMAARPLLPARAFRYVNHVKSNGIHLRGVPARDSVSIWAIGGGPGEQDLKIANLSKGWLEFIVTRDGEKISVAAQLWDQPPP